jgi:hypothetical protein
MAVVSKATLKTYFQDGKEPDENKYIDLIDTMLLADGSDITIGDGTGGPNLFLDGAAEQNRSIAYRTGGLNRWILRTDTDAESGGNAGSNFELSSRKDDGSWLANTFKIWRATSNIEFAKGGLAVGLTPPYTQPRGHLFIHDGSANDYGFFEAEGPLFMSANTFYDGSVWRAIKTGTSATFYVSETGGIVLRTDTTSRTAGAQATHATKFILDLNGNAGIAGGLYVGSSSPVTTAGRLKVTERLYLGGGIVVGNVSGSVDDDSITFYSGGTRVGEIGAPDTNWLRINNTTNKPIYSPRYMRIDGGVSATSSVSDPGDGYMAAQMFRLYEGSTEMGRFEAQDATWTRINQGVAKNIYTPRYVYAAAGLRAGGAAPDPVGGDITFADRIIKDHQGSDKAGNIYVPVTPDIRGTSWWATAKSTGGTWITVSTTFPGIPSNVRAINVRILCRDSATHPQTGLYFIIGPDSTTNDNVGARAYGNNMIGENTGICNVTNNTIYAYRIASGSGTLDCWLAVIGYFI